MIRAYVLFSGNDDVVYCVALNRSFNSFSSSVFSIVRLSYTHTRAHCTNEKQTLRRTAHKYESFERVRNPDRNHMMCICYACIVLRASTLVFPAYLSRRAHTPSNKMEYERKKKLGSPLLTDSTRLRLNSRVKSAREWNEERE